MLSVLDSSAADLCVFVEPLKLPMHINDEVHNTSHLPPHVLYVWVRSKYHDGQDTSIQI